MTPFGGDTYDPARDRYRLKKQLGRVYEVMSDGEWRTLFEISALTGGDPQASVSARLRDLRKERFGGYDVDHRCKGGGTGEYRLLLPDPVLFHD